MIDLPGARALAARERRDRAVPRAALGARLSGDLAPARLAAARLHRRDRGGAGEGARRRLPRSRWACATASPRSRARSTASLAAGARRIVVATLYPQHAESSRGTALLAAKRWAAARPDAPELAMLPPFFAAPGFVNAVAAAARPLLDEAAPRARAHELPQPARAPRARADPSSERCLARPDCCAQPGAAGVLLPRAVPRDLARRGRRARARAGARVDSASSRGSGARAGSAPRPTTCSSRSPAAACAACSSSARPSSPTASRRSRRSASARRERWLTELRGEAFALAPCVNASAPFVEFLAEQVRAAAR